MAPMKIVPEKTKSAIVKADQELQAKLAEGETTAQEELDMFALMKGALRLNRTFMVGNGLICRIASLGTEHSLLARRLSMVMNQDYDPEIKDSRPQIIDQHRLNSYYMALGVQDFKYKDKRDEDFSILPDRIPEKTEDVQGYLDQLQDRKRYIEAMLPGIYDRILDHLTKLAEEVERLSRPESLKDF